MPVYHLRRVGPPSTSSQNSEFICFTRNVTVIGRNPQNVDYTITSANHLQRCIVSRRHARVVRVVIENGRQHRLFDDSRNGIFVNDTKIQGSVILAEGDTVTFGHPTGEGLPPGHRTRQPDSEFQYIFEICNCGERCTGQPPDALNKQLVDAEGFRIPTCAASDTRRQSAASTSCRMAAHSELEVQQQVPPQPPISSSSSADDPLDLSVGQRVTRHTRSASLGRRMDGQLGESGLDLTVPKREEAEQEESTPQEPVFIDLVDSESDDNAAESAESGSSSHNVEPTNLSLHQGCDNVPHENTGHHGDEHVQSAESKVENDDAAVNPSQTEEHHEGDNSAKNDGEDEEKVAENVIVETKENAEPVSDVIIEERCDFPELMNVNEHNDEASEVLQTSDKNCENKTYVVCNVKEELGNIVIISDESQDEEIVDGMEDREMEIKDKEKEGDPDEGAVGETIQKQHKSENETSCLQSEERIFEEDEDIEVISVKESDPVSQNAQGCEVLEKENKSVKECMVIDDEDPEYNEMDQNVRNVTSESANERNAGLGKECLDSSKDKMETNALQEECEVEEPCDVSCNTDMIHSAGACAANFEDSPMKRQTQGPNHHIGSCEEVRPCSDINTRNIECADQPNLGQNIFEPAGEEDVSLKGDSDVLPCEENCLLKVKESQSNESVDHVPIIEPSVSKGAHERNDIVQGNEKNELKSMDEPDGDVIIEDVPYNKDVSNKSDEQHMLTYKEQMEKEAEREILLVSSDNELQNNQGEDIQHFVAEIAETSPKCPESFEMTSSDTAASERIELKEHDCQQKPNGLKEENPFLSDLQVQNFHKENEYMNKHGNKDDVTKQEVVISGSSDDEMIQSSGSENYKDLDKEKPSQAGDENEDDVEKIPSTQPFSVSNEKRHSSDVEICDQVYIDIPMENTIAAPRDQSLHVEDGSVEMTCEDDPVALTKEDELKSDVFTSADASSDEMQDDVSDSQLQEKVTLEELSEDHATITCISQPSITVGLIAVDASSEQNTSMIDYIQDDDDVHEVLSESPTIAECTGEDLVSEDDMICTPDSMNKTQTEIPDTSSLNGDTTISKVESLDVFMSSQESEAYDSQQENDRTIAMRSRENSTDDYIADATKKKKVPTATLR